MSDGRTVHRLLGGLLLWSLVPFPFLYIVLPPFWIITAAVAAWRFSRPGVVWRPPRWVLNLLAVAVLLAVVAAGGLRIGPLRPLGHLLLLLTAIRVATVRGLEDLRRAMPAVFLVALVGIVSASHVMIIPYLVLSLVVWWYAGMQVFLLEIGAQGGVWLGRPRWRHAAVAGVVAAILSVPTFILVPRLHSPMIGAALHRESGFSDSVELSRRGDISESELPALTVQTVDGREIREPWLRLRATAYDLLHGGNWAPRKTGLKEPTMRRGLVWLDDRRANLDGTVALDIELEERSRLLFLPPGTVAVEVGEPVLIDPPGGIVLRSHWGEAPSYRVWIAPDPPPRMDPPGRRDLLLRHPELRTARLATRITLGAEGARAKAKAIEQYLRTQYTYSLTGGPGGTRDPVSWFLFDSHQGHCEFFASAMVVLLRHEEIPARLVVGYNGGDSLGRGDRVVVRRSNAHTWVEAWMGPEVGWKVFDPTPAEGIDGLRRESLWDRVRLAWQSVEDYFDRRILTFGLGEQIGFLTLVGGAISGAVAWMTDAFKWWWPLVVILPVIGLIGIAKFSRSRRRVRRTPAARAVDRAVGRLAAVGLAPPPSATLRAIGRAVGRRWPATTGLFGRLIVLAEEELFGPDRLSSDHDRQARGLWREIRRQLR